MGAHRGPAQNRPAPERPTPAALAAFEADALRQRSAVEAQDRERSTLASQVSVLLSKADGFAGQIENLQTALKDAIAKIAQLSGEQAEIQPTANSTSDEELRVAYEKAQLAEVVSAVRGTE